MISGSLPRPMTIGPPTPAMWERLVGPAIALLRPGVEGRIVEEERAGRGCRDQRHVVEHEVRHTDGSDERDAENDRPTAR